VETPDAKDVQKGLNKARESFPGRTFIGLAGGSSGALVFTLAVRVLLGSFPDWRAILTVAILVSGFYVLAFNWGFGEGYLHGRMDQSDRDQRARTS
jgi:hypothetical protein